MSRPREHRPPLIPRSQLAHAVVDGGPKTAYAPTPNYCPDETPKRTGWMVCLIKDGAIQQTVGKFGNLQMAEEKLSQMQHTAVSQRTDYQLLNCELSERECDSMCRHGLLDEADCQRLGIDAQKLEMLH